MNQRRAGNAPDGPGLPDVFRVSPEPCAYHTERDVHAALVADPAGYLLHLRRSLDAVAAGDARLVLPPKQVFEDDRTGGDFRVMPCEVAHAGRVTKSVKLIGTNTVQETVPDQITVGKLLVLDARENYVSDVFEACLLSSARTGACAALAVSVLARSRESVAIIGSGRVGLFSALYIAVAGGVRRVQFCDAIASRAREAARWLADRMPAVACNAVDIAGIPAADVLVLATTSAAPVASPPGWGANLIVSLGADTDAQHELDPAWAGCADVYCDTLDSLRFGDLRAWVDARVTDPATVRDLLSVLRDPPPDSARQRLFISTGSALLDNLTARYLLDRAAGVKDQP